MMHTPEPWSVEYPLEDEIDQLPLVVAHGGKTLVCEILQPVTDEDGPHRGFYDGPRICAAVNACKGLSTEALESGVVAELVAACERAAEAIRCLSPEGQLACRETFDELLRIIAKAKGATP